MRDRELITISSLLTSGGYEPQLEVHINEALNVGIFPEEVIEPSYNVSHTLDFVEFFMPYL